MKEWMSVVVEVNGATWIDTSLLANGFASGPIWGTGARVVSLVIPRLFVTVARDIVTFCMEKLSLGAGSKCSTSLSSRGTAEMLRTVRKSPILKYRGSLLLVLKGDRKERYLDMRKREGLYEGSGVSGQL